MTAFTFGEATARVFAPAGVRLGSIEVGTFEDSFFAKSVKGECDRLIRMARVALDTGRRVKHEARGEGRDLTSPEKLLASLTAGAVRVSEELCTLARAL